MANVSSNSLSATIARATRSFDRNDRVLTSNPSTSEKLASSATTAERLLSTPSLIGYPGDLNRASGVATSQNSELAATAHVKLISGS